MKFMPVRYICLLVIFTLNFSDLKAQKVVPGDWEAHEAVWVPFLAPSFRSDNDSISLPLIRKLAEHVHTVIVMEDAADMGQGKSYFARYGVDTSNIRLMRISPLGMWLRDMGPVFYRDEEIPGRIGICDFRFTFYGNSTDGGNSGLGRQLDSIDRKIGDRLGMQVIGSELVLEGGAFDVNGNGTMVLVDSLVLGRNPSLSREQVEEELVIKLGIKSFIWLKHGLAQDPHGSVHFGNGIYATGTGGHTDHFVRFANDTTVLLYWEGDTFHAPDPLVRLNSHRMKENLHILENFVDHRGKRLKIIKIPSPGMFYQYKPINKALKAGIPQLADLEGDTIRSALCASYLNYVVTNGLILLPAYNVKTDELVKDIFQGLYPGREIFQLDPSQYNGRAGGIHCLMVPQPAGKVR